MMYLKDLVLFLRTVEGILLTIKYYSLKQNSFAILMKLFPVILIHSGLHEDLLYFEDDQLLILPLKLLPKYEITENLELIFIVLDSSYPHYS